MGWIKLNACNNGTAWKSLSTEYPVVVVVLRGFSHRRIKYSMSKMLLCFFRGRDEIREGRDILSNVFLSSVNDKLCFIGPFGRGRNGDIRNDYNCGRIFARFFTELVSRQVSNNRN